MCLTRIMSHRIILLIIFSMIFTSVENVYLTSPSSINITPQTTKDTLSKHISRIRGVLEHCQNEYKLSAALGMSINGNQSASTKDRSQSSIPANPGCSSKLKVILNIKNSGRIKDEPEELLLHSVYDAQTQMEVRLYTPLIVNIHQEATLISYPFKHEYSVNNKPYEAVLHNNFTCGPDGLTKRACSHGQVIGSDTANIQQDPGYCCSCEDRFPGWNTSRAAQDCQEGQSHISSHCLKFDALWYSVNSLGKWNLHQRFSIGVFSETDNGVNKFTDDTPLKIGTDTPSASTSDKKVTAVYTTLTESEVNPPLNYEEEVLLIPEPLSTSDPNDQHEQLKGGPAQYLVLPRNAVDHSGTTCDKVGVSFSAFLHQPNKCHTAAQSCLSNQPFNYWSIDKGKKESYERLYWLEARATLAHHPVVHTETTGQRLQLKFSSPVTNRISFTMDAASITLLREEATAVLVEARSRSADRTTIISAHVLNSGLVAGVFSMRLTACTPDLPVGSETRRLLPLGPQRSAHVVFTLAPLRWDAQTTRGSCKLQLYSHKERMVAERLLTIHRSDSCYCLGHCRCHCGRERSQLCEPLKQTEYHTEGMTGPVPTLRPLPLLSIQAAHFLEILVDVILSMLCLGLVKLLLGAYISIPIGQFGLDLLRDPKRFDEKRPMSLQKEMLLNAVFFFYLMLIPIHLAVLLCIERCSRPRGYKEIKGDIIEDNLSSPATSCSSPTKSVKFTSPDTEYCRRCSPRGFRSPARPFFINGKLDREAAIQQFRKQKRALQQLSQRRHRQEELFLDDLRREMDIAVPSTSTTPNTVDNIQGGGSDKQPMVSSRKVHAKDNADQSDILQDLTEDQRAFIERITQGGVRIFLTCMTPDIHLRRPGANFSLSGHLRQVDRTYKFTLGPNITQFYEVLDGVKKPLLTPLPINPKFFQRTLSVEEVLSLITEKPTAPCLNYVWDVNEQTKK